jgi:hypothetical protein
MQMRWKEKKKRLGFRKRKIKRHSPTKNRNNGNTPIEDKPVSRLPGFGEGEKIDIPTSTGGSEIPETKKEDLIFYNKKASGDKALEELDSETVNDINIIIKDYRDSKTRPEGIYTTIEGGRKRERFRPASTQPKMNEADKVELINLVIEKYKEKENKVPSATELTFIFISAFTKC